MPRIVILSPNGEQTTLTLSGRPLRLGRAEDCDFVLRNDAEVSRVHAEIHVDGDGRVVVTDRGSKNGTRVDDGDVFRDAQRVANQLIRIGEHEITVLDATPAPEGARVIFAPDAPTTMGDTQFFPSTRGLDLSAQRLSLLIALGERIGGVFERKQLLEEALDSCCEALGFERGLIVLKTHRGDTELPVTRNVQRDDTGAFKVSRTLINRALIDGQRAVVNNPATDLEGNLTESLVRFPICSALCVPIINRNEILGVIYGDRITQASTYTTEDVDFLAAIAQQTGVGLANLRLFQEHVASQRMYAELDRARVIQQQLLPAEPMRAHDVLIQGYNQPSSAVSGDYFDYFRIDDERLGLIIADVTGHGLPAALVMANLQAAVRVALTADTDLPSLAKRVNKLICENTSSGLFITAILGTVHSESGAVEFVSAGHHGPVLVSEGQVRSLDCRGSLPLGVEPDESFDVVGVESAGKLEAMMFYTDGLIEAENRSGDLLGIHPVTAAIAEVGDHTPAGLIRTTRAVVTKHADGVPVADDLTLLALSFRPPPISRDTPAC